MCVCVMLYRGCGLFVGCELVRNRATRVPATSEAQHVIYALKQQHTLLSADGPHRNVLKFKPPMCFSLKNVDTVCAQLDVILGDIEATLGGSSEAFSTSDVMIGGSNQTEQV